MPGACRASRQQRGARRSTTVHTAVEVAAAAQPPKRACKKGANTWWWKRFLLRMTLTARRVLVRKSWHLRTWPKLPLPRIPSTCSSAARGVGGGCAHRAEWVQRSCCEGSERLLCGQALQRAFPHGRSNRYTAFRPWQKVTKSVQRHKGRVWWVYKAPGRAGMSTYAQAGQKRRRLKACERTVPRCYPCAPPTALLSYHAASCLQSLRIIHHNLKPENIPLRQPNRYAAASCAGSSCLSWCIKQDAALV